MRKSRQVSKWSKRIHLRERIVQEGEARSLGGITNAELITFDGEQEEEEEAKGTSPCNGPREKIRMVMVACLMVAVEVEQVGDGDGTSSKELTSTLKTTGGADEPCSLYLQYMYQLYV